MILYAVCLYLRFTLAYRDMEQSLPGEGTTSLMIRCRCWAIYDSIHIA
jgi:hypothetical protein